MKSFGSGRFYPSRRSQFFGENDPFLDSLQNRDNGGVHINSSIINNAFYLLAEGLNGAIGIRDAERIFYRALTVHLTANSQFIDARLACLQSAEELFGPGSQQRQKTAEAFDIVEISDAPPSPGPPDVPPISASDSTLFVFRDQATGAFFLGRREDALDDPLQGIQLSSTRAAQSRPSVSRDGIFAAFVRSDHDVCLILTDGAGEACLGVPGVVSSVSMSPNGELFGFVLLDASGNPTNQITVIDLRTETEQTFTLRAPVYDGTTTDTILFADAMDFTLDHQFLIYDALNRIAFSDGTRFDLWSIYALHLGTGVIVPLVPPVPDFDIGFPSLSQTSDNFLTFGAVSRETGQSGIFA